MNKFPDEWVRIESADVQTAAHQLEYLPLYAGGREIGRARSTRQNNMITIIIHSQGHSEAHTIRMKKATGRVREAIYLECPKCRKWRKRLFFTETNHRTGSASFRCQDCTKRLPQ